MDYRVELDAYAGPMDLLLYLIKEAEVDIYDIPVGTITEKYLKHLEAIEKIDLNRAGEFLVLASQLMEVKAKMLIPRETIDMEETEDPRSGLVQELLEYRKFKDASRELGDRLSQEDRRFPRPRIPEEEGEPPEPDAEAMEDLGVYDLLTAFGKIRKEILAAAPSSIVYDDVPVRVHMERIVERLSQREALAFHDLILETKDRREMIGVFLALLELVKIRWIRARQATDGEEILITLREKGPLPFGAELTSAAEPGPAAEESRADAAPSPAETPTDPEPPSERAPGEFTPTSEDGEAGPAEDPK